MGINYAKVMKLDLKRKKVSPHFTCLILKPFTETKCKYFSTDSKNDECCKYFIELHMMVLSQSQM